MGACVGEISSKTVLVYAIAIITFIPNILNVLFLQCQKLLNKGDCLFWNSKCLIAASIKSIVCDINELVSIVQICQSIYLTSEQDAWADIEYFQKRHRLFLIDNGLTHFGVKSLF